MNSTFFRLNKRLLLRSLTGLCLVTVLGSSSTSAQPTLAAATLPTSRSAEVGKAVTGFATVINAGPGAATGCSISPVTLVPATFLYQTTDPATNAVTGSPNTPVDIDEGGSQSFVIAFTPGMPFAPVDVELGFDCANTSPAASVSGLNTLLLSASSTPVPDIIALATGTGTIDIPAATSTAAFAVATVNVGAAGTITASADTGSVNLPVSISVCETNPATGACINPSSPAATATTTISQGATPTFAFFITATGNIPFDPAANRARAIFRDGGQITRGSTSTALRSQPPIAVDISGSYTGSGTITTAGCQDPMDNETATLGLSISIGTQSAESFSGTFSVDPASLGPDEAVSGMLTGTVDAQGAVSGTMTVNAFFNGAPDGTSSGTFSGSLAGNTLSIQISLQEMGDTCMSTGPISVSR